ncbi:hypothetical protein ACFQ1L_11140 [Phytohabitans flavus]
MRLACWQAVVRREDGERRLERLTEVAARAAAPARTCWSRPSSR